MTLTEILLLAVGLSMDAFAVAVCKGLATKKLKISSALIVGLWFGIFQGIMPLIGWILGSRFADYITSFDHWIAFCLLALIGGNMIREALSKNEEECDASLAFGKMFPLAIATSIDALAVGVTFACVNLEIVRSITSEFWEVFIAVNIIAVITFILSAIGVKIGNVFGIKYKSKAEFAGGLVLVLLGIKILLEHLGIIGF